MKNERIPTSSPRSPTLIFWTSKGGEAGFHMEPCFCSRWQTGRHLGNVSRSSSRTSGPSRKKRHHFKLISCETNPKEVRFGTPRPAKKHICLPSGREQRPEVARTKYYSAETFQEIKKAKARWASTSWEQKILIEFTSSGQIHHQ